MGAVTNTDGKGVKLLGVNGKTAMHNKSQVIAVINDQEAREEDY